MGMREAFRLQLKTWYLAMRSDAKFKRKVTSSLGRITSKINTTITYVEHFCGVWGRWVTLSTWQPAIGINDGQDNVGTKCWRCLESALPREDYSIFGVLSMTLLLRHVCHSVLRSSCEAMNWRPHERAVLDAPAVKFSNPLEQLAEIFNYSSSIHLVAHQNLRLDVNISTCDEL